MASPVIVLATYCLIHILIFRRQGIIKDEGIYKSIFFVIGVIMYFQATILHHICRYLVAIYIFH